MRDSGLYCDNDVIHVQCLRFCYMSVLQDELHRAARLWNVHKVRTSSNPESPPERPDILYFLPEITETQDFLMRVELEDFELAKEVCYPQNPPLTCSSEFKDLADIIMQEQGLTMPQCPDEDRSLHIHLLNCIKDIEDSL